MNCVDVFLSVRGCLCEEGIEQRLREMWLGEQARVLLSCYNYLLVEILSKYYFCDNLGSSYATTSTVVESYLLFEWSWLMSQKDDHALKIFLSS